MKIPCVPILPNRFCRILKEEHNITQYSNT